MSNDDEEYIATLIHPDEYAHHNKQVDSHTSRKIRFLALKLISSSGVEMVQYPLRDCLYLSYAAGRSYVHLACEVLMVLVVAFLIYMFGMYGSYRNLSAIPVGIICLTGFVGVRWAFGSRRHRLSFAMADGRELVWRSSAGDFKYKQASVANILNFARANGLLDGRLPG